MFEEEKQYYENALRASGYTHNLKFQQQNENTATAKKQRQRKIKIIWFNPPYNQAVKTNIATKFLHLIEKHFPKGHKLNKIFNRNSVKVSYSCMPNMKTILDAHNKIIVQTKEESVQEKLCNCRKKERCPLKGECLRKCLIYEATITANDKARKYIGSCETTFKSRFANHKSSFADAKKKNATRLSNEYWKLKAESNVEPVVTWSIVKTCKAMTISSKVCKLCLSEKVEIMSRKNEGLLNMRSEMVSCCRHVKKFLLHHYDSHD